nr:retrovirus-related Pol polyprotein from transposon TNT 1-94 [Tanacetum cinerariifolium]
NSLVHSLRALSTLRHFGLRTASAVAKPCQGDSLELYLITGSIYTDKRGTVLKDLQHSFRNSDACYYVQEKCGHAGPKVTTSQDGVDNTKTRRPQPRSNTKNNRVPSVSKSSRSKNNEVEVEEHHRKLLLSRNKKHMPYECNNVKLATQNVKSKVVCAMCKQCLHSVNHDVIQICLWCVDSGCSKHMIRNLQLLINFVWKFLGTVRFENDHVAAILGFSDLQWGNILITRVYFVEGLGHNLFSVGQLYDSDLEVAFRRNACFVRNLEGVDLLKGNCSTNLSTINLHEMASASPICLMARTSSTKSWLWHQRLSHLNFDTINDFAKNDLVFGLPKFKYHKEHLCPSCEPRKSKRASHLPKPVTNSRQRLHILHMDLCGLMRLTSINGKPESSKEHQQPKVTTTNTTTTTTTFPPPQAPQQSTTEAMTVKRIVIQVKQKQLNLRVRTKRMIFNIYSAMKHFYSNDDTCFSIDDIDEILEEDFDALLDEGSKILLFIEGTLLEEEIFS